MSNFPKLCAVFALGIFAGGEIEKLDLAPLPRWTIVTDGRGRYNWTDDNRLFQKGFYPSRKLAEEALKEGLNGHEALSERTSDSPFKWHLESP